MGDFRMQQELEEERLALLDSILQRVARGRSDANDARELARELGLSKLTEERYANQS
jgi:hypothetical protein